MKPIDFDLTTRVISGIGRLPELGEIAARHQARHVLLVTDDGLIAAGHVDRAMASLQARQIQVHVFSEIQENPTTAHVRAGVAYARQLAPIDLIVGLGGGSAMDCAKGINFQLTNGGEMQDYMGFGKATKPMLPSIGVPTTTGTGSESQSFALISREDDHVKMACGDRKARFRDVILDPELCLSAPREVITATGIDAISHALESHVCTRSNVYSRMLSAKAWQLLDTHFEAILAGSKEIEPWARMQLGAHLSGAAIEHAMLGAAHACANPLTARFGITHGLAVGLMLPHVIRFNADHAADSYAELAKSPLALAERVDALLKKAAVPRRLRDYSIEKRALQDLAAGAMQQWTGTFNPRPLELEHCLALYEAAY